jgi:DNA-binding response OmpR family regulator
LLVIDDDEQYRRLVRRMLETAGHEVLDAPDAAVGQALFREHGPDLVITDILMPETDGIELITSLRRERPNVRIIAISGGGKCPPDVYLTSSQYLGATRALSKPFRKDELLEAVNSVLEDVPPDSI